MKTLSASLLSGVSVLLLSGLTVSEVSLNLSPNRLQFFSGDSVSLSCVEAGQTVDGTVRRTRGGTTDHCGPAGSDFGLFQDSSCVLDLLSSYSGLYWCETSSGRSDRVQISVFRREEFTFILEIPAHPVTTGSEVTLRCRNKDGSSHAAYFFKNNAATGDGAKVHEFTIRAVQRSDQGLYSCSTDVSEPSPQSWLRVREPTGTSAPSITTPSGTSPPPDVPSLPSHPAASVLAPAALCGVVVLVLVLVLVGLVQLCKKQTDKRSSDPDAASSAVTKHTAGSDDVTYSQVVVTRQATTGRKTEQPPDLDVVYSSVRVRQNKHEHIWTPHLESDDGWMDGADLV